jgi:hypothetical protein
MGFSSQFEYLFWSQNAVLYFENGTVRGDPEKNRKQNIETRTLKKRNATLRVSFIGFHPFIYILILSHIR